MRFKTGECKEDIARPYQDQASAAGRFGLVLVGNDQVRQRWPPILAGISEPRLRTARSGRVIEPDEESVDQGGGGRSRAVVTTRGHDPDRSRRSLFDGVDATRLGTRP